MPGNRCYVPEELGETFYIATIANPAAGTDWIYTVPAGYEYQVTAVWWRVTTDATVITRYPMFVMWRAVDGIDVSRQRFQTVPQSTTRTFNLFARASRLGNVAVNGIAQESVPQGRMTAGDRFGSATSNLQAADQIANIRVLVARWRI